MALLGDVEYGSMCSAQLEVVDEAWVHRAATTWACVLTGFLGNWQHGLVCLLLFCMGEEKVGMSHASCCCGVGARHIKQKNGAGDHAVAA